MVEHPDCLLFSLQLWCSSFNSSTSYLYRLNILRISFTTWVLTLDGIGNVCVFDSPFIWAKVKSNKIENKIISRVRLHFIHTFHVDWKRITDYVNHYELNKYQLQSTSSKLKRHFVMWVKMFTDQIENCSRDFVEQPQRFDLKWMFCSHF